MKKTTTPVRSVRNAASGSASMSKKLMSTKSLYAHPMGISHSGYKGSPQSIVDRVTSPKPEWNSLQNEDKLTSYKLTKEEIVKRKQLLMSKHNIFYNNGKKFVVRSNPSNHTVSNNTASKSLNNHNNKNESCLDLLSEDDMNNTNTICSSDNDDQDTFVHKGALRSHERSKRNSLPYDAKKNTLNADRKSNNLQAAAPYSKEKYSLSQNMDFLHYSSEEEGSDNYSESGDNISRRIATASTPLVGRALSAEGGALAADMNAAGEHTPADQKVRVMNTSGISKPLKKKKGELSHRKHPVGNKSSSTGAYVVNRPVSSAPDPLWELFDGFSSDEYDVERSKSSLNYSRASHGNNQNTSHLSSRSQGVGDESDLISIYNEVKTLRAELKYFEGLSGAKSFLNMKELDTALDINEGTSSITIHKTMKFLTQLVCQTMTYLLKSEVEKDGMLKELASLKNRVEGIDSSSVRIAPTVPESSTTSAAAATGAVAFKTLIKDDGSVSSNPSQGQKSSFYRPSEFDAYSSYTGPAFPSFPSTPFVLQSNPSDSTKASGVDDSTNTGSSNGIFSAAKDQMSGTSASDWLFKKSTPSAPSTPNQTLVPSINVVVNKGAIPMRVLNTSSDTFSITDQSTKAYSQLMEPKKSNKQTPEINSKKSSSLNGGDAAADGAKGVKNVLREPVQFNRKNHDNLTGAKNPFSRRGVSSNNGPLADNSSNNSSIGSALDSSTLSANSNHGLKSSMDDYNNRIYDYIHRQGILNSASNASSPDRSHLNKSNLDNSGFGPSQKSTSSVVDTSMVDAYEDWMNRMTAIRTSGSNRQNAIESTPTLSQNTAAARVKIDVAPDNIFEENNGDSDDDDAISVNDSIEDGNSAPYRHFDDMRHFDDEDEEDCEEEEEEEDSCYHKTAPVPFEAPRHPNSL